MTFTKDTLFRREEVKWEMMSFLDSNFFTPIFFVGTDAYTEEQIATLRAIQKRLREDRARLLDARTSAMLKDLDTTLPEWRAFDTDLDALGLPTTLSILRKMILIGRFSEHPLAAFNYSFGFWGTKKSG